MGVTGVPKLPPLLPRLMICSAIPFHLAHRTNCQPVADIRGMSDVEDLQGAVRDLHQPITNRVKNRIKTPIFSELEKLGLLVSSSGRRASCADMFSHYKPADASQRC